MTSETQTGGEAPSATQAGGEAPSAGAEARAPSAPMRLRLLGFSTVQMLARDLTTALAARGWAPDIEQAGFGEVIRPLLQPSGADGGAGPGPDAVVVALDGESLLARDWRRSAEEGFSLIEERLSSLLAALESWADRGGAPVLVNTLASPLAPSAGLLDRVHAGGEAHAIAHVNARLADLARSHGQVVLVDTDRALAEIAPMARLDPKLWFYGRIAWSAPASQALAEGFAEAWEVLKAGPAKVLALDLDNTLWGGTVGEDGISALACGDDFPGNAFKAFQAECLRLRGQGFLLTILSKNEPEAIRAFAEHPGMLLREEDFVAWRIDWSPKPDNIRALAGELDLGLDSFVFLDDSPHEREAMRRLCPEVRVPELPEDPARRPLWLRTLAATWPVRLTAEDAGRSDMVRAEHAARRLKAEAVSYEDYLAGLEQRLALAPMTAATLPRIAQMHARTNQFNLTTRRLGEAELTAMMGQGERYAVLHGRLADKFGDHGIVICAVAEMDAAALSARIESLLMSCRVIGREVEEAFVGALLRHLAGRGIASIHAAYIPTAKNAIVRDFWARVGFSPAGRDGEATLWHWREGENALPGGLHVQVAWSGEAPGAEGGEAA